MLITVKKFLTSKLKYANNKFVLSSNDNKSIFVLLKQINLKESLYVNQISLNQLKKVILYLIRWIEWIKYGYLCHLSHSYMPIKVVNYILLCIFVHNSLVIW